MPQISIIIPLLNKGPYIARALESVMSQTFQDFEVIVVDGGSIDNGPQIVRNYTDERIKCIYQSGRGVSSARNQGVARSKSDLLAFLDADDEWTPHHLSTIFRLREIYPDAGAYTTAYKIMRKNTGLRWANLREIPPPPWEGLIPNYFRSATYGDAPVWTSSVCIPREIFQVTGGFPEDAWWGEDADLFGKIALKYQIAFSWVWGATYHWDLENRLCSKPSLEVEPVIKTLRNAIKKGDVPEYLIPDISEYIARKEIYRAVCHLYLGHKTVAGKILKLTDTKLFLSRKKVLLFLSKLPYKFSHPLLTLHFCRK